MMRLAVFGHPIAHSKSPQIHQTFARQCGLEVDYQALLAPLDGFEREVKAFFAQGGVGCNVTLPFKEQALALADSSSQRAALAGAANTLILKEGQMFAENTDGLGLVTDLLALDMPIRERRVLLLGAGGAARGALLPLLAQAPAELIVANRTESKAQKMIEQSGQTLARACGLKQLGTQTFDLIINASSASLHGQVPDIDAGIIHGETDCYDMMYGKQTTAFNLWAQQKGVGRIADGLGMLVEQAAESFRLWTGQQPDGRAVLQLLRQSL